VFSYDGLSLPLPGGNSSSGTNLANGFASGLAASMISAKTAPDVIIQEIRLHPGRVFQAD